MSLFTKQNYIPRLRKQTYGYQRGKVVGKERLEVWDGRVHTAYLKQITNKDLLYSTGNSAQCYVTA